MRAAYRGGKFRERQGLFRQAIRDPQQFPDVVGGGGQLAEPCDRGMIGAAIGMVPRATDQRLNDPARVATVRAPDDPKACFVRAKRAGFDLQEHQRLADQVGADRVEPARGLRHAVAQGCRDGLGPQARIETHLPRLLGHQRRQGVKPTAVLKRHAGRQMTKQIAAIVETTAQCRTLDPAQFNPGHFKR